MSRLRDWLELVAFEHTLFALPFAYLGLLLGSGGTPAPRPFLLVTLCMVGARSAAMAYNRVADRDLDAKNPRTAGRPIPSGRIGVPGALLLFAASAALLVFSAAALNPLAFALSPVALVLVTFYSHTKRFTALSHLALGLCLAAAPVGGFIAATGKVDPAILVLAAGVALWTAGFDVIYALQDAAFDRAEGLRSIPAALGPSRALALARLLHLAALLLFAGSGLPRRAGFAWYAGVTAATLLLVHEHRLAASGDPALRHRAFFQMNALVSAALLAAGAADLALGGPRV